MIGARNIMRRSFSKILTVKNINQPIVNMEFAVRGEVVSKAADYEKMLAEGKKLDFEKLVYCNIGNPHALKQKPISFLRQILAVVNCPELLNHPNIFPKDVYTRAKYYIDGIPGGTGAYSNSRGVLCVRKEVADFIQRRDGYPVDPENIFLTDGASAGVQTIIRIVLNGKQDGLMIPIPQYPLYSATIDMCEGKQVHYYIDEKNNWTLNVKHLKEVVDKARGNGISVKGITVINPGNPTGTTLDLENMRDIVRFCNDSKVVLMADEVYQENLWSEKPFISFRKVACDLGKEAKDAEIISFHSVSKGAFGECGRRGGYFELYNIDSGVTEIINKYASVCLCSNIDGQVTTGILVNPPKPGEPSHHSFYNERNSILASLKRRAIKITETLNKLEGVQCQKADGALYAFPKITIPAKAVNIANSLNKKPDMFYCLELLKHTGLVSVPGSGFGQIDGTYHFRSTILPPESELDDVLVRVENFHAKFMKEYK